MLRTHAAAALPRISLSHDTQARSAVTKSSSQKLSAVPSFQPEATCLTPAEIRHIVQDILG